MAGKPQKSVAKIFVVLAIATVVHSGAITSTDKLTPEQNAQYQQFKQNVMGKLKEDYMKTDFYLIRWMESKKFNVKDATKMLQDNLVWRQKNKMDSIMTEDFSDVKDDFWLDMETHDKIDRPIGLGKVGSWLIRNAILGGKQKRVLRWIDCLQETLVQNIFKAQAEGKNVSAALLITNMDGFSETQHLCPICTPVLVKFINGMEAHYPAFVDEIIMFNAPATFDALMAGAKDFLSPNTMKALRIFNTDESKWKAYLDEIIDKDQRYESFGGTRKD